MNDGIYAEDDAPLENVVHPINGEIIAEGNVVPTTCADDAPNASVAVTSMAASSNPSKSTASSRKNSNASSRKKLTAPFGNSFGTPIVHSCNKKPETDGKTDESEMGVNDINHQSDREDK